LTFLRPNIFIILLISVNMVLMCILGGKGTVAGPIIGAILIIAFNETSVAFLGTSEINILSTGLIMVVVIKFYPNGIVGTLARMKKLPRFLNWD
jgi:branched-chain amino acid transport system permease protein